MESQSGSQQLKQAFLAGLSELLSPAEIAILAEEAGCRIETARFFSEHGGLNMAAFLEAIVARYGHAAGRGLAVRAGRAAFKYGMGTLEPLAEMKTLTFRLMPVQSKLKQALERFCTILAPGLVASVSLSEEEDRFLWRNAPAASYPAGQTAWVHGFIQEGLYWLSNGKFYPIEEVVEKQAGNEGSLLVIPKKALE